MGVCLLCHGSGKAPRHIETPCSNGKNGENCRACQDLFDLEALILETTEKLHEMRKTRYELLSEVNRSHDRIASRFPSEVFAIILQQALPSINEYNRRNAHAPVVASHVSAYWRRFALGTPSLWTTIPIIFRAYEPAKLGALPSLLARSGELPISIVFNVDNHRNLRAYWFENREAMQGIMGLINQYSPRLAFLKATGAYDWFTYLDLETLGAPLLQHLEIATTTRPGESHYSHERWLPDDSVAPGEAFLSNPSSQRIRVGNAIQPKTLILDRWTISQLGIGTARIVDVHLTPVHLQDCLNILENCPVLQHCSLREIFNTSDDAVNDHIIRHSELRKLDIQSGPWALRFLSVLELPQLQHFSAYQIDDLDILQGLLLLVQQSSPPLQVLELEIEHSYKTFFGPNIATLPQVLSSILRTVDNTIEHISFTKPEEPHIIYDPTNAEDILDGLFPLGCSMPMLRSMSFFVVERTWASAFLGLVQRLSALPFDSHTHPPQVTMHVWLDHLDESYRGGVHNLLSASIFNTLPAARYRKAVPDAVSPAVILAMLSLIDIYSLNISVSVHEDRREEKTYRKVKPVDIFPEVCRRLREAYAHPNC